MRIVVNLGEASEALSARISSALGDLEVVPVPPPGEEGDLSRDDVVLTMPSDTPVLRQLLAEGVGWVHVLGTGVDGFPLGSVPHETVVTCSRGASGVPIAEFVLAAMLSFEKDLPSTWITEPPERWSRARLGTLAGKTCALVGLGAIGCEVARRALAFDMNVLAVRNRPIPSPVEGVEVVTSLDRALASADHLVLAAPATDRTTRLVDAAALQLVRPGLHLVNVARGSLVDQDALLAALDDGRVGRATLDVVEPEPLPAGHPFYSHPSVRLSPHVSWSAPVTMGLILEVFVENVARRRAGEELAGLVDPQLGY